MRRDRWAPGWRESSRRKLQSRCASAIISFPIIPRFADTSQSSNDDDDDDVGISGLNAGKTSSTYKVAAGSIYRRDKASSRRVWYRSLISPACEALRKQDSDRCLRWRRWIDEDIDRRLLLRPPRNLRALREKCLIFVAEQSLNYGLVNSSELVLVIMI